MVKTVFAIIAVLVVWYVKEILFIVFLAFILSSSALYVAGVLNKEHALPKRWGIALTFGGLVVVLGIIVILLVPAIVAEGYGFVSNIPSILRTLQERLILAGIPININVGSLQDIVNIFPVVGENTFLVVQNLFDALTFTFLTIMLGLYISLDPIALDKVILLFVPNTYDEGAREFLQKSRYRLGNWVVNQLTIALTLGIAVYMILGVAQMKYAILLSMLWGLSELIPYIGPIFASIPILILSFTINPLFGLAVFSILVVLQVLKYTLLIPVFVEKKTLLNPFAVVLALMIGWVLGGGFGLLIATPFVSVLTLLKDDLERYLNVDIIDKVTRE